MSKKRQKVGDREDDIYEVPHVDKKDKSGHQLQEDDSNDEIVC